MAKRPARGTREGESDAAERGERRSLLELSAAEFEAKLREAPSRASPDPDARLIARELPADDLAELRRLAEGDATRTVRSGRRVILLPGIMGSELAIERPGNDDTIWIDLFDMIRGRLRRLAFSAGNTIVAPDVIGVLYSPLRLRLRAQGFDAAYHPFDWRRDIRDLGRELAGTIKASPVPVDLVAHSMGGLVARMALTDADAAKKVERLVTLGTPHAGSFAVTMAFDGSSSVTRLLDKVDCRLNARELATLFAEFPGLAGMLPDPTVLRTPDFTTPANWPTGLPRPSDALLGEALAFRGALPGKLPGVELIAIAGTGHATNDGASVGSGGIAYTKGEGDGTVPLRSAATALADRTFYLDVEHAMMPSSKRMAAAVGALLNRSDPGLATSPPTPRRLAPPPALRAAAEAELTPEAALEAAVRPFLAVPDGSEPAAPAVAATPAARPAAASARFRDATRARFVTGAGSELRLEIQLRLGNLLDCAADCYALGLFAGVDPAGAALAIDAEMEGAVTRMVQHRMLSANVGEISVLPNGRHLLRARAVAFVGLGVPASFRPDTMEAVGTSLMRAMIATRMDELAMIPFGTSAGQWTEDSFGYLIQGFVTALKEQPHNRFRALTFCDRNPDRIGEVRQWLRGICTSTLAEKVELVVDEAALRERQPTRTARVQDARAYLFLTQRPAGSTADAGDERKTHAALLEPRAMEAAVAWEAQPATPAALDDLLDGLTAETKSVAGIQRFGTALGAAVLAPPIAEPVAALDETHLVLVHGEFDTRLPWETLHVKGKAPALLGGVSHRYLAPNRSVAKWNAARDPAAPVAIFLVGNPTSDLPGAETEAKALEKLAADNPRLKIVRKLYREEATLERVLDILESTEVDLLHYAGHAFFDRASRTDGGLLLHGEKVLTGRQVMTLGRLPALVFLNACEAARVRGEPAAVTLAARAAVEEQGSLAEALLRSGVGNFLGTYWPVGDEAAMRFAEAFYARLAEGQSLNTAVRAGRRELHERGLPDWANYVFYGDPDFGFAGSPGQ
jgi:hypothetical protein